MRCSSRRLQRLCTRPVRPEWVPTLWRGFSPGQYGPLPNGHKRDMNVPEVDVQTAAMSFAPDAQAPRLARRFVGNVLSGRTDEGSVEVARLLVSELVTNAVVHAASAVEVEVTFDE